MEKDDYFNKEESETIVFNSEIHVFKNTFYLKKIQKHFLLKKDTDKLGATCKNR